MKKTGGLPTHVLAQFMADIQSNAKELNEIAVEATRFIKESGESAAPKLAAALRKAHFLPKREV